MNWENKNWNPSQESTQALSQNRFPFSQKKRNQATNHRNRYATMRYLHGYHIELGARPCSRILSCHEGIRRHSKVDATVKCCSMFYSVYPGCGAGNNYSKVNGVMNKESLNKSLGYKSMGNDRDISNYAGIIFIKQLYRFLKQFSRYKKCQKN